MKITQEVFDCAYWFVLPDFADDCERIVRVAKERLGLTIQLKQADEIWREYSDSACASWLCIHNDDEIVGAIDEYVDSRLTLMTSSSHE